ncbi:MAG: hypothetical protein NW215_05165 [Hyphomicrobiales bacterium]|nr:hypothetical protein [Hyphomicrobiales bacterium]
MKIYISGALHASRNLAAARALYEATAFHIEELGHEAYLPHLKTDPVNNVDVSPQVVYGQDKREILSSDLIVAFLNEPSFGVGAELVLASQRQIPMLALNDHKLTVSRFLVGHLLATGAVIRTYETLESIKQHVSIFVKNREAHSGRLNRIAL